MPSPIRVLELRCVRGTGGGPEKTILLGAQRSDPASVQVIVGYIRDARDRTFRIDRWAEELGVEYVELRERHSLDPAILGPLVRTIRDRGVHVVHGHDYKSNVLALAGAALTGAVPMTTAHGWTGHSRRERWLYYPLDRGIARLFPRVVAVSEQIRQTLIRAGVAPDRVTTLLNGVDARTVRRDPARAAAVRAALGLPPDALVLGAVGRLEPQKRFDLLLDALADLAAREPRVRLVIAGDGSERARLATLRTRLGLDDRCALLGDRTDVADLHNAFDLFVQASDYEGTPNAVLEAMALQTPVVATDAGGTSQLIADGVHGWIVPCGDRAGLTAALQAALASPAARAACAAAARGRVEGVLSFDARQATLDRLYHELVRTRGTPGPSRAVADLT